MAEERKVELTPDFEGAREYLEEMYPNYLTWSSFRSCGGSGGPHRAPGYSCEKIAKMAEEDFAWARIMLAFSEVASRSDRAEAYEGMCVVSRGGSKIGEGTWGTRKIYLAGRPYRGNPGCEYTWDPPVIWGLPESPIVLEG